MANKNITNRPIIIVSDSQQRWDIDSSGKLTVCRNHQVVEVKPKEETLKTGRFVIIGGRYQSEYLLPNGTWKSSWACRRDGDNWEYPTFKAAKEVFMKKKPTGCTIRRIRESYYNTVTKEVTFDKKVAKAWFKGQKPLFISNTQYQRAGMWIEPGTDYITITLYYTNRVQREGLDPWQIATETVSDPKDVSQKKIIPMSFRLYNDGTVSHFIRGGLRDVRYFEETRRNYRTLDIRFPHLYRLATTFCDLRSEELIGPDGSTAGLCPETLKILQKCGFPTTYWCWGDTKREFKDTYDLVNFATHVQHKSTSNVSAPINEFLADKPLTEENLIIPHNKGIIIRIPGFRETWQDSKGKLYTHRPYGYECNPDDCKLIAAGPYERYRVWVSNNGKKRNCQELVHEGTMWKTTQWSNIHFPQAPQGKVYAVDESDYFKTAYEHTIKIRGVAQYNSLILTDYSRVFELLPCLSRLKDTSLMKNHPDITEGRNLYGLLGALYSAPKLTETLIKLGYESWFYERDDDRYYYSDNSRSAFELEKMLSKFAIDNKSSYKESSGKSLYANLGVTKEQFNFIATHGKTGQFMRYFAHLNFRIPGKTEEFYHGFNTIPVKYVKLLYNIVQQLQIRNNGEYYRSANTIRELIEYGLCFTDLEKVVNRELDLNTLHDYLRMRKELSDRYRVTVNFDIRTWPLVPSDPTDLRFTHNRIMDLYNLALANEQRYWRENEEKRMIERQEKYVERYKKLKKMNYEETDSNLIIVVPEKLVELVVEGQILHHCVGSFVSSVAEGKDTIVFLRRKDAPNTPYATISLLRNDEAWYIDQAHTAHNGAISTEDVTFLKRWAKANNVLEESVKLNYGLHCHH